MVFTDEQLAVKSKHGEKQAFEELVKRFQQPIYTICYRYLGNSSDAWDAAQNTFIRLYNKFHLYDAGYPFRPWLYRIAVNSAKDLLKKRRPWEELDHNLESSTGDPAENLLDSYLGREIEKALLKLPEKYRMALILRHIKELEYQEIADVLRLPLNTVKTHVRRGRELLRKELQEVEL
ncbi:MAG: RNA polymerase sigma factor [Peptococcaceae bacterium]